MLASVSTHPGVVEHSLINQQLLIKFTNANTENSLHFIIQYKNGSL